MCCLSSPENEMLIVTGNGKNKQKQTKNHFSLYMLSLMNINCPTQKLFFMGSCKFKANMQTE